MKPKSQPQKRFDMEAAGSLTPELEYAPHTQTHARTTSPKAEDSSAKPREVPDNRGERS
jgi:hypothetical protein